MTNILLLFCDGGDAGRWCHAKTLGVRCSSRGKARAWDSEASIEGVVGLVSHLSKAASVKTHFDCCCLWGLGYVLSLVDLEKVLGVE